MLDLVLYHPIPIAMAAVMILWALSESLAAHRRKPVPVPATIRSRRIRRR